MAQFWKTHVYNILPAMEAMRNPLNSWINNDTVETEHGTIIGENDYILATKLIAAGPSHSKFLRQIFVSVNITAPVYWWREMDTYKIGTTLNSCSTMHKLQDTKLTIDDFALSSISDCDELNYEAEQTLESLCELINDINVTKSTERLRLAKQLLPQGYNMTGSWTGNYAVLRNIAQQRKQHRLTEWSDDFISWIKTLPYCEWILSDIDTLQTKLLKE